MPRGKKLAGKIFSNEFLEKYKDPRWQRRRLEVMEKADFKCEGCESEDKTLNVHHKYYLKNRDPWDYPLDALICLCDDCHQEAHRLKETLQFEINKSSQKKLILGFCLTSQLVFGDTDLIKLNSAEEMIGLSKYFGLDPYKVLDVLKKHNYEVTLDLLRHMCETCK